MSAGHPHRRVNLRHARELDKLLAEPDVAERLNRRYRLVVTHDTPDLAGYSVDGTTRYLDPEFWRALKAGELSVPNMTAQQIAQAVLLHEGVEKALLDAKGYLYPAAHEFATAAEHEFVRSFKATPRAYEAALAPVIARVRKKPIGNPARDLACAPYLDDPDAADERALKQLRAQGVADAEKVSKKTVAYGAAKGEDRCGCCRNLEQQKDFAPCEVVDGLVRTGFWCKRFERGNELQKDNNPKLGGHEVAVGVGKTHQRASQDLDFSAEGEKA